jgi:hypothetical protein
MVAWNRKTIWPSPLQLSLHRRAALTTNSNGTQSAQKGKRGGSRYSHVFVCSCWRSEDMLCASLCSRYSGPILGNNYYAYIGYWYLFCVIYKSLTFQGTYSIWLIIFSAVTFLSLYPHLRALRLRVSRNSTHHIYYINGGLTRNEVFIKASWDVGPDVLEIWLCYDWSKTMDNQDTINVKIFFLYKSKAQYL